MEKQRLNNSAPADGRNKYRTFLWKMILLTLSAVVTAIDTKTFINTGNLFPGGVGGLTLLIIRSADEFFHVTLAYTPVNILLNAVPVYIGFRFLGKKFTAYSCYTIVLASIITDMIPNYVVTSDILLISVFGGIISGFASVLCLWADSTAGGLDFISVYLSVKRSMDAWNLMLGVNVIILVIAGLLFGWDKALYSIIFQYAFTQVITALYHKYQQQTLFIITEHPREVSRRIYEVSCHGATILEGKGSYENDTREVLYSVVSRGEVEKVMSEIRKVDADAFINSIRTEKVKGYFYQRPTE